MFILYRYIIVIVWFVYTFKHYTYNDQFVNLWFVNTNVYIDISLLYYGCYIRLNIILVMVLFQIYVVFSYFN